MRHLPNPWGVTTFAIGLVAGIFLALSADLPLGQWLTQLSWKDAGGPQVVGAMIAGAIGLFMFIFTSWFSEARERRRILKALSRESSLVLLDLTGSYLQLISWTNPARTKPVTRAMATSRVPMERKILDSLGTRLALLPSTVLGNMIIYDTAMQQLARDFNARVCEEHDPASPEFLQELSIFIKNALPIILRSFENLAKEANERYNPETKYMVQETNWALTATPQEIWQRAREMNQQGRLSPPTMNKGVP